MLGLFPLSLCLVLLNGLSCSAGRTLLQSLPPTTPAPTPAPTQQPGNGATQTLVTSITGTPTPTPTPTPSPTPVQTAAPAPYCTANIQPGTVWSNGDGTYMSVVNIYLLTHRSSDIQAPWTFSIHNNNYISVFQAWNWQSNGMDSTGTATGSASDFWETIMANGQNQVNIGAILKGRSPQNFYPQAIAVNRQPCQIQQLR